MMQIYHFSNFMFVVMALPPRFGWSFWHFYLFCTNTNEVGEFELNILKITNFDHCNPKNDSSFSHFLDLSDVGQVKVSCL